MKTLKPLSLLNSFREDEPIYSPEKVFPDIKELNFGQKALQ